MANLAWEVERRTAGKIRLHFHIYADDVLVWVECELHDLNDALSRLQSILDYVDHWMRYNFLLLNAGKTEIFLLHGKRTKLPPSIPSLSVGGQSIPFMVNGCFRWLGVFFDESLTMNTFIDRTCRSCYALLRMLRQVRNRLDVHSATMLCNALVLSRVDYCVSALAACPAGALAKLQKVLNLAARTVIISSRDAHIAPILKELGWLPVERRIALRIVVLIHQCNNGAAPTYLSECLRRYVPKRPLRSSAAAAITFELGTANLRVGRGSWSVAGPTYWNVLPAAVRHPEIMKGDFLQRVKEIMWD
jgi:hypothetical protein